MDITANITDLDYVVEHTAIVMQKDRKNVHKQNRTDCKRSICQQETKNHNIEEFKIDRIQYENSNGNISTKYYPLKVVVVDEKYSKP